MEDLVLLSGIVHPAEIVEIIERINSVKPRWNLLGFLIDNREIGSYYNGKPILGSCKDIVKYPDVKVLPIPSAGKFEEDHGLLMESIISVIDPSCFVDSTVKIGKGVTLFPNCFVGHDTVMHDFVFSMTGSIINHDNVIESGVMIASGVNLAGHVHVERDCYLGAGTKVRQGCRIGEGAMTGMGSVVVSDVEPHTVVVGNPAKKLRDRD